jgi:hypothetical protein
MSKITSILLSLATILPLSLPIGATAALNLSGDRLLPQSEQVIAQRVGRCRVVRRRVCEYNRYRGRVCRYIRRQVCGSR